MNLQNHAARLEALKNALFSDRIGKVMESAAGEMLVGIKQRVQVDGLNSNGTAIGTYSTKPMYAGQKQFADKSAFQPRGNGGKPAKGSKTPKTMYLVNGYKQLRIIQNKKSDAVNASYTGQMLNSYVLQNNGSHILMGLDNKTAADKRRWTEGKYGPILSATTNEMSELTLKISQGTKDLTIQNLTGNVQSHP